ncbi:hypothetical protein ONE63_008651 [Megalurothrips usitatus]|uniref:Uncharacterized protein n=1 Tax=Megalurothrips usitatus TaxID=439358 RepID=A0AAV7XUH1_9NEOP|nr:hypothetical protein ONE63_008651 [Megalurothrips usitatus]
MLAPAARATARAAQRAAQPSRSISSYTDIVASPPTVRISFGEKVCHGILLAVGILGYPLYATSKVAAARREEYAGLEIPENWASYDPSTNLKK